MTAQVEFFCSASEENRVIRYLTKAPDTQVFDVSRGSLCAVTPFDPDDLPYAPEPVSLYIWQPSYGSLIWHTSAPAVGGPTHSSLVHNLFAREHWEERALGDGDRMLDTDLSPILQFQRGETRNGKSKPALVLAPPSNLQRVGPEYERWVKRSLAWIRRKGVIVHDYRSPSTSLENPDMILNTIYAFPDAQRELESSSHGYVITFGRGT